MRNKKQRAAEATKSPSEILGLIKANVGPVIRQNGAPIRFTHLTGPMLRKIIDLELIEFGAVKEVKTLDDLPEFDITKHALFKEGAICDEDGLQFLEENPRFFAQGYIYTEETFTNAKRPFLLIDTIVGGERRTGEVIEVFDKPLSKKEILAFANLFHKADEFEIGDTFAHAWFD
jgi:hypothetical protein